MASEGSNAKTCEILAYTGGFLNLPNFNLPVVVELLTASFVDDPLLLRDHNGKTPVGHITAHKINDVSIVASGILSIASADRDEVVDSAKDGFPWGASIGGDPGSLEEVAAGVTVNINGQSLTGPFLISHDTVLKEISICSRGVDSKASVSVAAQFTGDVDMTFEQWLELVGIDPAKLTEAAVAELQTAFNAMGKPDIETPEAVAAEGEEVAAAQDGDEEPAKEEEVKASVTSTVPQPGSRVIQASVADMQKLFEATAPAVQVVKKPKRSQVIEAAMRINSGTDANCLKGEYDETVIEAADSPDMRGYGLRALFAEVAGPGSDNHAFGDSTIRAALNTADPRRSQIEAAGFSTVSLPNLLSNLQGKELRRAYDQYTGPSLQLMSIASASDFKQQTSIRFSMGGGLSPLGPGGEIKNSTSTEDTYTSQIETKAEMFTLSRQMIINDDLGAFSAIPSMYGLKAARSIDIAFSTLLLANTGDFFGSTNLNESTTALSIAGITAAEILFMNQVDTNGDPIINMPKFLVVPPSLATTAKTLMSSSFVNETTTSDTPSPGDNPHANSYEVVVDPYLSNSNFTGSSATDWYLWSDPNIVSPFVITFLNGQQRPTIENADVDFNKLGMSWRCFFDFGIDQNDFRGAVKADVA